MFTKTYWMSDRKKPNLQLNDVLRVVDLKKMFSKRGTTNWSFNFYEMTENIDDTKPNYHNHNLPERYNEALLENSKTTLTENKELTNAFGLY